MSCTTCCQNTSNSLTSSGIPRNFFTGPSLPLPLSNAVAASAPSAGGSVDSPLVSGFSAGASSAGVPDHAFSTPGVEGASSGFFPATLAPLTRSASRLAASSSARCLSSGFSLSASRAAYAASRSMSAMTICLMLTRGWRAAVASRNGPSV